MVNLQEIIRKSDEQLLSSTQVLKTNGVINLEQAGGPIGVNLVGRTILIMLIVRENYGPPDN